MKKYILFIFIGSLLSCKTETNKNNVFDHFPETKTAKNKELIHQLGRYTFARQLGVNSNHIYLFDFENRPYIRKYDSDFQKIDSFGIASDFNIETPIFQHFDRHNNFVFINEGEFLNTYAEKNEYEGENTLSLEKSINLNESLSADGVFQAFHLKDALVADAYYPKKGDMIIKKNNEASEWLDFLISKEENPEIENNDEFLYVLYRNKINVNPNNTKIVQAFSNFPLLQIIKPNGERKAEVRYMNSSIKTSNINELYANFLDNKQPSYVQYLNTFTTEEKVYALYLNQTWEDILKFNYSKFEIHVFDWDLKPISSIEINDHIDPLGSFVVLENTNEIIFLNPNQDDTYYTKWNF